MKKHPLVLKISTIAISFLIVSIMFLPWTTIRTTQASNDIDLIKVTTQAYDINGGCTSTVFVTQQQLQEIQHVFDELKNRLSIADTEEETQHLFNDTILSLSKYNLLPKGMTIEQAKRLVNSANSISLAQRISTKFPKNPTSGTIQNTCCYIAGNTSNTHFTKLAQRITHRLIAFMDYNTGNDPLLKLVTAFWFVFNIISKNSQTILYQNGPHFDVCIYYGNYHYYPYPNWLFPAQGWISTIGLNGKQNISGSFWGQKMTSGWQQQDDWYMNHTWMGCRGFTGLITYIDTDSAYYLGSALEIHVAPNRP